MPGRTALRSQMRQSGNMDSKELWSSTRDRLVTAVTALGYPEELGHEIAKHTNSCYQEITKRLCDYAERDETIKAVIAIGSSARSDVPADEFSDLDLIIVTSTPPQVVFGGISRKARSCEHFLYRADPRRR